MQLSGAKMVLYFSPFVWALESRATSCVHCRAEEEERLRAEEAVRQAEQHAYVTLEMARVVSLVSACAVLSLNFGHPQYYSLSEINWDILRLLEGAMKDMFQNRFSFSLHSPNRLVLCCNVASFSHTVQKRPEACLVPRIASKKTVKGACCASDRKLTSPSRSFLYIESLLFQCFSLLTISSCESDDEKMTSRPCIL